MSAESASRRLVRRRRSDGERSRSAILREAARLATVDGLDGLSLARLADAVGMSKSGLFAHFGSKEELQLATIDAASAIFEELVIEPAGRSPPACHGCAPTSIASSPTSRRASSPAAASSSPP